MTKTYQATLEDDRLVWADDRPPQNGRPLIVRVTVVEPPPVTPVEAEAEEQVFLDFDRPELAWIEESQDIPDADRGRLMAEALEGLAKLDPFADIDDPVAWQREIRKDRPLPGRE